MPGRLLSRISARIRNLKPLRIMFSISEDVAGQAPLFEHEVVPHPEPWIDIFPLADLIDPIPTIKIVDVGAMWLGAGTAPYSRLLDEGLAEVIGFEPVEDECRKVNDIMPPPHICYPYAIGKGGEARLHICDEPMTSSLYPPNTALLKRFSKLNEIVQVVREISLDTKRLDDVLQPGGADLLKIDVQGAELDVLSGAAALLSQALVVQVEVEFVPLYRGQPLFAEVDMALRNSGFSLFTLLDIQSRAYNPFDNEDVAGQKTQQLLWADAVYVKSLFDPETMDHEQLLRTFVILHFVYGAFDLCHQLLGHLDKSTGNSLSQQYASMRKSWLNTFGK